MNERRNEEKICLYPDFRFIYCCNCLVSEQSEIVCPNYMNIRLVTKKDLPAISVLNEHAIPHVNRISIDKIEWFTEYSRLFVVAEKDNDINGFMIVLGPGLDYDSLNYKYFESHYKKFDYVDRIVVAESSKRQGIGTALYNYLIENSATKIITCEVNLSPPNPLSIKFHEQFGFKEVARQKSENGKKLVSLRVRNLK